VLLAHRRPDRAFYPDVWDFVGGHVEPGETLEAALVRELQEELGIMATAFRPYTIWRTAPDAPAGPLAYHLYHVTAWQGTLTNAAPAEHTAIRWVPLAEAPALPLADAAYRPLFAELLKRETGNVKREKPEYATRNTQHATRFTF
jgi:8-oxo-dGTP diphosphatase